ncbi:type II secretion system F family protein [Planctomicrobium sp. SH661]|uniref:type II secretion system F family protein n=1 Tax=Planctomicrobium sp. SH661 TaxID=3448124 RepID=UPI003F5AF5A1
MDISSFSNLLPLAVFGAVMVGVWAIAAAFTNAGDTRVSERLQELKDPRKRGAEPDSKATGIGSALKKAAPAISKVLTPQTELEESKLKVKLANAGFSSPHASTFFLAIKTISLLVGLVLGGGIGLYTKGLTTEGLMVLGIGGGLGMFLPDIVLGLMAHSRKSRIFLSLPDALDLLVVCVEAGLGLDAAMRRVAEELSDGAKDICYEINHSNFQLQMGRNRREVLHDLGVRTGVDDVKALAAILIQADKFGSSIAHALRVQSDAMRIKRSQLAEEKAAMTAVKMIFPLVLFIFPGIFVVLVGPAAIMMIRQLITQ